MSKILGISAFFHDSAAAIIVDGRVMAAAQEERFTRHKHTSDFPIQSIKYCLEAASLDISELDAIVFYDKPLLKFERLLETYYAFAPRGVMSFIKAIPRWISEKVFLKKIILESLVEAGPFDKKKVKLLFSDHHLSHAASSFYVSPYNEAAILTIDAVGEWSTASIAHGNGNKIKIIKELNFPHSVGLLYSSFTYYLGFKVNSGEYKLMGLAPYGISDADETLKFEQLIKRHLVDIKNDGSIWLNQHYFDYAVGQRMAKDNMWEQIFDFPRRDPEQQVNQQHCNFAFAIQKIIEEIILKMAAEAKRLTGSDNLCMAGGVALNCVANGKLQQSNIFRHLFIQPAAGDSGGAIGAALAVSNMYFEEPRQCVEGHDQMQDSFLGPEFSNCKIESTFKKFNAVFHKYESFDEIARLTAKQISDGKVVGWFQGRMEFGPRALGNRSILADPRNPKMQQIVNLRIKNRESFRPFAASVLSEDLSSIFDLQVTSRYMLLTAQLKEQYQIKLPTNFQSLSLLDKLTCNRSVFQAVTHLDNSTRIQTVHLDTNPRYWRLIDAFKQESGYGLLLNTSFNVRGEPIVCSPEDAFKCFMSTDIDLLVVNDFVLIKSEQVDWFNKGKWVVDFEMD